MTGKPHPTSDEWRELMVAALYDELAPDERRRLDARLAADPALAADWRQLVEARELLARDAFRDELATASDFELPPLPERRDDLAARSRVVASTRWWLPATGGFAAAAALFVGLLIAGLRIDSTPQGWLVAFSRGAAEAAAGAPESEPAQHLVAADRVLPDVLTRDDFASFANLMLRVTDDRLTTLERRQQDVQTELASTLFTALATTQQRQYDDLRLRLQLAATRWPQDPGAGLAPAAGQLGEQTDDGGSHDQRY